MNDDDTCLEHVEYFSHWVEENSMCEHIVNSCQLLFVLHLKRQLLFRVNIIVEHQSVILSEATRSHIGEDNLIITTSKKVRNLRESMGLGVF